MPGQGHSSGLSTRAAVSCQPVIARRGLKSHRHLDSTQDTPTAAVGHQPVSGRAQLMVHRHLGQAAARRTLTDASRAIFGGHPAEMLHSPAPRSRPMTSAPTNRPLTSILLHKPGRRLDG